MISRVRIAGCCQALCRANVVDGCALRILAISPPPRPTCLPAANLLVGRNNQLKIADWGLARSTLPERPLTPRVVTLWYRAPELLLGQPNYTKAIDVWSAGCVFGELLTRRPILPGAEEPLQLEKIFRLCGVPTAESWPGHEKLPRWKLMAPQILKRLKGKARMGSVRTAYGATYVWIACVVEHNHSAWAPALTSLSAQVEFGCAGFAGEDAGAEPEEAHLHLQGTGASLLLPRGHCSSQALP